ncbi:MAG: ribokinase [Burkholderiaceae bacterium]
MNAPPSGSVLVVGSANLDYVVRAAHVPAPGETVLGRDFATFPGGKGANQAVACARAGDATTRFVAAFGDDDAARPLVASLIEAGVQLVAVRIPDTPTGTAFICVSDTGENAITVAPGANDCLAPDHLPSLADTGHLLMQLETPLATVQAFAEAARAAGVVVVLNAAPAQVLPRALLAMVDVLVVNEGELDTVAGSGGTIAERMARVQVPTVVTTLGARGACARTPDGWLMQAAWPVDAIDTTAAGDTFCGVFVAARARGDSMASALCEATVAAALACTRPGAQASVPARGEVERFAATASPVASATLAAYCGIDTSQA